MVLAASALFGCSDREHENPFDPENPHTGGVPALLTAVAGDGEVLLAWDLQEQTGIDAVRLLRRIGAAAEESILAPAGRGAGSHTDRGVANGSEIVYRLALTVGRETLWTRPDTASPGPSRIWVGDAAGAGLIRISPDGRDATRPTGPARDLLDVRVEPSGTLWAADFGNGAVIVADVEGQELRFWDCYGANTLALDRTSGEVWVGSFRQRSLLLYDRTGTLLYADSAAGPVERVRAAPGGGVWSCASDGQLRRVVRGAVQMVRRDFVQPVSLCVDSTGWLWVADRGAGLVHRMDPGGMIRETSPVDFVVPVDVEADGEGGAWVADPGRGGVAYLDASLSERGFIRVPDVQAVRWEGGRRRLWACRPLAGRVEAISVEWSGAGGWRASRQLSLAVGGRPAAVDGF